MRKSRFTDAEMVAIVREADREPPGVVAKRHKVSECPPSAPVRHF